MAKVTYSSGDVTIWKDECANTEEYQELIDKTRKALDKRNANYDETDRGSRYIFSEKNN